MYKLQQELSTSDRKLKETTICKYICSFKKTTKYFLKEKQFQSYSFLQDTDKIINYLDSLSDSQKFNQLKAICIVLNINKDQARKGYKKHLKIYRKYLSDFGKDLTKKRSEGIKTDKEKQNWLSWEIILKHVNDLYDKFYKKYFNNEGKCKVDLMNCTKKDLFEVQKVFILAMYVFLPPRRLELAKCKYIKINEFNNLSDDDLDSNIYLVHINRYSNFISYGKLCIKNKTNSNLKIKLTEKLNNIYSVFINLNYFQRSIEYGNSLLFNSFKKQMSTTSLCIYLKKYFKTTFNKEISVTMLRKSYHTFYSRDFIKELDKIKKRTIDMNHSIQIALMHYCKTD